MKKILFLSLFFIIKNTNAQFITTVAGTGIGSFNGDGGKADTTEIASPSGVIVDGFGNIYIADADNNRIRKINSTGIISTIAGDGTNGHNGDGNLAVNAQLWSPKALIFDPSGNLYIADLDNACVRRIDASSGIITTYAGTTTSGYVGDGGQATAAQLDQPNGLAFDASGNLYISEGGNNLVRKVNTSGIISTFAGNYNLSGFSGDGGAATNAAIGNPGGVCVDNAGNVYVADGFNACIRKISTAGIISTIAGTGGSADFSGDGGQATAAQLSGPTGISVDLQGNLYVVDGGNSRIRKVNTSGIINTIVGNGMFNYSGDGGLATAAGLNLPNDVTIDQFGNLYIADEDNDRIRFVCNNPDNISGSITEQNSVPVQGGQVYVFSTKMISPGLLDTAGSATIHTNGTYTFSNVPAGDYFIQAVAAPSYSTAITTYFCSTIYNYLADSATIISHVGCSNTSYSGYNITIDEIPAQTGIGVISGSVTNAGSYGHRLANNGYNQVMGSPLKGIDVKLGKTPGGGCSARTTTDPAGTYTFTGVDTGSYFVYVDIPNYGMDTVLKVTISASNPQSTNNNYCIDSVTIGTTCIETSGINNLSGSNKQVLIYPNPTSGNFTIETNSSFKQTLQIIDINGRVVLTQIIQPTPNPSKEGNKINIDVANLNEGVYNINVSGNEGITNKRLVIVK